MVRNLFAGIGFLTVLVALIVVGWIYREDIASWLGNQGEEIVMSEPSPELALRVERTFEELAEGGGDAETRFTETELQSYVQYRLVERLPQGVEDPAVDLRDSTMAVSARLDLTRLEVAGDAVEGLRRMLGDSARVTGELYPVVDGPGRGRVHILALQAGVFPVPPFLLGGAIQRLGLESDGSAVLIPIPADVVEIRIENEQILLLRDR